MLALLLIAAFGMLWLFVATYRGAFGMAALSVRGAFVAAFVLFELFVVAITETASVGHHLTRAVVAITWGVVVVALFGALRGRVRGLWCGRRDSVASMRAAVRVLDIEERIWLAIIASEFIVLGVIGWLYPPSNGDSMVYHLPRVEHWIQNRSVAPYASHYLAQVELSPLHEYNLLHLHLLWGGDRLDGYMQLSAAIVCVVGASEVARLLGARRKIQVLASLLCATIPSLILEATSTQNNVFAGAIGVAMLVALLAWSGPRAISRGFALGAVLGLVVLAKGTLPTMLGGAAVVALAVALRAENRGSRRGVVLRGLGATFAAVVLAAMAVAGPFLWRNVELFGGPIGPVSRSTMSTDLTLRAGLANVVRSSAGNFMIGNGRDGLPTAVSRVVLGSLGSVYSALGVAPGDVRYSLGTDFNAFKVQDYSARTRSEEVGANPVQVVLIVFAVAALAASALRSKRDSRLPLWLGLGLCCGYLAFTATARWSVFAVRYEVPLFVAWCPVIAIVLGQFRRATLTRLVVVVVVIGCVPQLIDNSSRSLLHPRYHFSSALEPYFADGPLSLVSPKVNSYDSLTRTISESSCHEVGIANWVLSEYPIWAGLRNNGWKGVIEDVNVTNASRTLEHRDFRPCAWIRQETVGFVSADTVHPVLVFGELQLAIDPSRVDATRVRLHGFSSRSKGIAILPGGGWSQQSERPGPILAGRGWLYLFATSAARVRVELRFAAGQPRTRLAFTAPEASRLIETREADVVELRIAAGVTRLRVVSTLDSAAAFANLTVERIG
jgi:hypothetical protein